MHLGHGSTHCLNINMVAGTTNMWGLKSIGMLQGIGRVDQSLGNLNKGWDMESLNGSPLFQ